LIVPQNQTLGACGRWFWADKYTLVLQWHHYTIKITTMSPISGSKKYHRECPLLLALCFCRVSSWIHGFAR
jgi:hypothetical protein